MTDADKKKLRELITHYVEAEVDVETAYEKGTKADMLTAEKEKQEANKELDDFINSL